METIERVAIKQGNDKIWSMAKGNSHQNVEGLMRHCGESAKSILAPDNVRGFITSTGRFVSRGEAMTIARAANQLPAGVPEHQAQLYSYNL